MTPASGMSARSAARASRAASRPRRPSAPAVRAAGSATSPSAVDFDNLKFGLTETDSMFVARCDAGSSEWAGGLEPYGDLRVHPSAAVLNYGQGCFEGMKAYTTARDRIVTFRPRENARRMHRGALELAMPPVPEDFFVVRPPRARARGPPARSAGARG